jgi:chaperonin cofactor prefoldin
MLVISIIAICFILILTIPTIVIAVRSSMATSALDIRVSALETMINTAGATQKSQMSKMTKIVSDLQHYIRDQKEINAE